MIPCRISCLTRVYLDWLDLKNTGVLGLTKGAATYVAAP